MRRASESTAGSHRPLKTLALISAGALVLFLKCFILLRISRRGAHFPEPGEAS
jgi:hypothetical protein